MTGGHPVGMMCLMLLLRIKLAVAQHAFWFPQASGSLKQKRDIDIQMCGATLRVEVKDASTEWAMRLAGRLKQESLGKVGGLIPMLHEVWILELPSSDTKCNIHEDVIKGMQAARACAVDMLAKADLTCFSDICKVLSAQRSSLSVWLGLPTPSPLLNMLCLARFQFAHSLCRSMSL
jgi:hypothetical protein